MLNNPDSVFGKVLLGFEDKFLLNYVEQDRSKLLLRSNDQFEHKLAEFREYSKNNIIEEYMESISYELREMRAFREAIETRKSVQGISISIV